jgi:hypothetical protein
LRAKNGQHPPPLEVFLIETLKKACFYQRQVKICHSGAFCASSGRRRCYDVDNLLLAIPL